MLHDNVLAATRYIRSEVSNIPSIGLILGTGLKGLIDEVEVEHEISYSTIPNFPTPTVVTHGASLIFGKLNGKSVVILSGRFHYYEGYSMQEVTFGIRTLAQLGVQNLVITNITGSTNPLYNVGDIVLIKDHINLQSENPLRIRDYDDRLGPRFPSMLNAYSEDLRNLAKGIAAAMEIDMHEGIYTSMDGPSLETPAEYAMINKLGGDVVGMSTVPEVIVAKQQNLNTIVFSMVSNKCFPIDEIKEDAIDVIIQNVEKGIPPLKKIIRAILKAMV